VLVDDVADVSHIHAAPSSEANACIRIYIKAHNEAAGILTDNQDRAFLQIIKTGHPYR
jgi:hypothetical protein